MTFEKTVAKGAAISGRAWSFIPIVLAVAEIHGKRLFWVAVDPQNQSDAHVMNFTRIEQKGNGFTFYNKDEHVAYVAPFFEYSEGAELLETWQRWQARLSDEIDWFKPFVDSERKEQLS